MNFTKLTTENELIEFQSVTKKFHHTLYPLEYLKRCDITVLRNSNGKICGGYAFALDKPFRSIGYLTEKTKTTSILDDYNLDELFEINCLWLDYRSSKKFSYKFWLRFYVDIIKVKKKAFIYTYDLDRSDLTRIYDMLNSYTIFEGLCPPIEGNYSECYNRVELLPVKRLKYVPVLNSKFILKRVPFIRNIRKMYKNARK